MRWKLLYYDRQWILEYLLIIYKNLVCLGRRPQVAGSHGVTK